MLAVCMTKRAGLVNFSACLLKCEKLLHTVEIKAAGLVDQLPCLRQRTLLLWRGALYIVWVGLPSFVLVVICRYILAMVTFVQEFDHKGKALECILTGALAVPATMHGCESVDNCAEYASFAAALSTCSSTTSCHGIIRIVPRDIQVKTVDVDCSGCLFRLGTGKVYDFDEDERPTQNRLWVRLCRDDLLVSWKSIATGVQPGGTSFLQTWREGQTLEPLLLAALNQSKPL